MEAGKTEREGPERREEGDRAETRSREGGQRGREGGERRDWQMLRAPGQTDEGRGDGAGPTHPPSS